MSVHVQYCAALVVAVSVVVSVVGSVRGDTDTGATSHDVVVREVKKLGDYALLVPNPLRPQLTEINHWLLENLFRRSIIGHFIGFWSAWFLVCLGYVADPSLQDIKNIFADAHAPFYPGVERFYHLSQLVLVNFLNLFTDYSRV